MEKEFTSVHRTVEEAFTEIGIKVEFAKQEITMEGKKIEGDWKKVKECLEDKWKKGKGNQRDEDLQEEETIRSTMGHSRKGGLYMDEIEHQSSENQCNYKHARADGQNEGMEEEKKPDK